MATIENVYGSGVIYTAAIDLGAQKPLDSRIAVQTITERDAHVTGNRAFPGMQVYVADDEKTYVYNGADWDVLVTDADLTEGIDVKIAAATTGKIGGILSGDDVEVDTSGNATVKQADKLRTSRTVTFAGGDATGSFTFDGSADVSNVNLEVAGLDDKVNITGQIGEVNFTGATVKVKTLSKSEAQGSADKTEVASIGFVSDVVDARIAQSDAMIYKGTISDAATLEGVKFTAKTGWTYRVTADIDFTGKDYIISDVKEAHAGDLIICRGDGSEGTAATWDIVKHNDDGQIIGPDSSVADRIVTFSDATGKVVKDSGKTLADISTEIDADVAAVKTELIGDSGDTSSENTFYGVKKYADEKVSSLESGVVKEISIPTPSGDSAPSASVSDNIATINLPEYALNSSLSTLSGRVSTAENEIDALQTLTGGLGDSVTVKSYVDNAVNEAKSALIGTEEDLSSLDTIYGAKKYAEEAAAVVSGDLVTLESKVNANTTKLADVTDTVGSAIDSKINNSVGESGVVTNAINTSISKGVAGGGVIDNAIDSVISAGIADNGVIDNRIDAVINSGIANGGVIDNAIDTIVGSLDTTKAYTSEEVTEAMATWAGFSN